MITGALSALRRRWPRRERLVVYRCRATTEGANALAQLGFERVNATDALLLQLRGVRQPHQIDPLRTLLRKGLPGTLAIKDGRIAGHAFLAVARDRPTQFGGIWLYPGEMAINALFVLPEFRGCGLGGALHRQLVADAVSAFASVTNVAWTADYNVASQRMLRKHCGVPIGTVERWVVWQHPMASTYRGEPPRR